MLRPSESSTLKASSDAATDVASGITVSRAEVVIPGLQQVLGVLVHETSNVTQLCPSEATAAGKAHGFEPELGNTIVPLDVNMRGFATIAGIEEAPIRANSQDRRHRAA